MHSARQNYAKIISPNFAPSEVCVDSKLSGCDTKLGLLESRLIFESGRLCAIVRSLHAQSVVWALEFRQPIRAVWKFSALSPKAISPPKFQNPVSHLAVGMKAFPTKHAEELPEKSTQKSRTSSKQVEKIIENTPRKSSNQVNIFLPKTDRTQQKTPKLIKLRFWRHSYSKS